MDIRTLNNGIDDSVLLLLCSTMPLCVLFVAILGCEFSSKPERRDDLATAIRQARSLDPQERRLAIARMSGSKRDCASPSVVLELARLVKDRDADVRWSACIGLGTAAEYATGVKSELVVALRDPEMRVRSAAASSLGEIGSLSDAEVRALAELLSDPDRAVRFSAEGSIAGAGTAGKAALPALEKTLYDSDGGVAAGAASTIGKIGLAKESTVDALIRLVDRRLEGQGSAAWALGSVGPIAHKAIPSLQKALASTDATTRAAAARSLWKLNGNISDTVPMLVRCLNVVVSNSGVHYDYVVKAPEINSAARRAATEALVEIGRSAKPNSDAVRRLLEESKSKSGGPPSDVVNEIMRQIDK
jgi:HEAT repeat protein